MRTKVILGASLLSFAPLAHAAPINLVQNGGFEATAYKSNSEFGSFGGQGVTNWTGGGGKALEFYYFGGTQNSVSARNRYGDPKGYFYPSFSKLSPNGGNFVALDGDLGVEGSISQNVSGLIPGKTYLLSFYWAATQLANRSGPTREQLIFSLGGRTYRTPTLKTPARGFSPGKNWRKEQKIFRATGVSEVLSFLEQGYPGGLPPVSVLDGVSLTSTSGGTNIVPAPEPGALGLLTLGLGSIAFARPRRR